KLVALDRRGIEQHRRVMSDAQLNASLQVLADMEGGPGSPYTELNDLGNRENLSRGPFALGRHRAEHPAAKPQKTENMSSVPRLAGEDQSKSTEEARAESLWKLGYIDDDGVFDPDSSWDPMKTTKYVWKTKDEVEAEHHGRRMMLREHLDNPQGFPDGHP